MLSSLTLSIGTGLLVGLTFIEFFSLFCGGVIVPGYLAYHLDSPANIVMTFSVSLLSYYSVQALAKVTLLYGRRQYVAILIFAFIYSTLINQLLLWLPQSGWLPVAEKNTLMTVIGFVIPGLIANWFERQGVVVTMATAILGAILVRLILIAFGFF